MSNPAVQPLGETDDLTAAQAENARLRLEVEDLRARLALAEAAADHDVLTKALNRRGFMAALQRTMTYCQRHSVPAVLIYLDLDGFKGVNDRLGHAAGDAALIRVADILLSHLRESDAVGRIGGDEFALLMLNADQAAGKKKAGKLSDALKIEGFEWDGATHPLGGSFGARAFDGQTDAEAWLSQADAAMWVRKRGR